MLQLPDEIILLFFEYLDFRDIANLSLTNKYIPSIKIFYNTYSRDTIYVDKNGKETIQTSYLLTNGPPDLPGQIKHNFVEIKLYRGLNLYSFVLYKNVYNKDNSISDYLKMDWHKKIISLKHEKIQPHFQLK